MSDDGKPPLYPPNVKPPPLPARARELKPAAELPSYELETADRMPVARRAQTVNTGIPRDKRPYDRDAGGGWVRAAFLLLVLVAVSVGAYVWKGR